MRRLLDRLLNLVAPSVPLGLHGRVTTQTSVPVLRGEARPGAGSGGYPAGEDRPPSASPRPLAHPEALDCQVMPCLLEFLNDFSLAATLDSWSEQIR